jgi:hypothetical protein
MKEPYVKPEALTGGGSGIGAGGTGGVGGGYNCTLPGGCSEGVCG